MENAATAPVPQKWKIELVHDTATLLLDMYAKNEVTLQNYCAAAPGGICATAAPAQGPHKTSLFNICHGWREAHQFPGLPGEEEEEEGGSDWQLMVAGKGASFS